jgi:hypothetical protein
VNRDERPDTVGQHEGRLGGRADNIFDEGADSIWSHAWHQGDMAPQQNDCE